MQPVTEQERLEQVRLAKKKLGTTIPWLVDKIDNRFKHAMGNRPNSEFIISPEGKIIVKRAWSNPGATRRDLEKLVGKSATLTQPKDLKLKLELPSSQPTANSKTQRVDRKGMFGVVHQVISKNDTHFAKLRVEATPSALQNRRGKLYLGFHLDPLHEAKWNNLSPPLSYSLKLPRGVKINKMKGAAEARSQTYDAEPREFLLDIEAWPPQAEIIVTVSYAVCIEESCIPAQHQYRVRLQRDKDSGGARSQGAGVWDPEEFIPRLFKGDKNGDGKLSRTEVMGLIRPHFEFFDVDQDQLLDAQELKKVVDWLNDPIQGIKNQLQRDLSKPPASKR